MGLNANAIESGSISKPDSAIYHRFKNDSDKMNFN